MANLNYNRVTLAGRLTEDPKLSSTPAGTSVCRFSVAYNRPGRSSEPDFFTVDAWREKAEFVSRYFRRGSSILIEGRLRTERWEDKKTGAKRSTVVIEATDVYFVDSKAEMPEREAPEPDEVDMRNAKPSPGMYATPGARAGIEEEMAAGDELPL